MMSQTEEIKAKLDIVDVISEFVPLRQSGANFKGLCPFHNEKTPSFMVSREKQFFKCFGCGESGDMFSFLEKIENIEFPEALKILAAKAGVEIVRQDPQISNLKTRLLDLHKVATEFFTTQLCQPAGGVALRYLVEKRKLKMETIQEFKLGYAPDSWQATGQYLKSRGFNDYELKQSGLVVEKTGGSPNYYDRFRARLIFPISDYHGNIVGFTARAMSATESAKYINSPQTLIYNKSQVLYALDKAKEMTKKNNLLVLVEGNMDAISSFEAGVKNVVAVSGTSLTVEQIKTIKRYCDTVAICFDADAAGAIAGMRGISLLWQEELNVKVIVLPDGIKDPDELIHQNLPAWLTAVNGARDIMEYLFVKELNDRNVTILEEKRKVAKVLLPWIAKLTDPLTENYYLKQLAEKLAVDEGALRQAISKLKAEKYSNQKLKHPVVASASGKSLQSRYLSVMERILALMLFDVRLLEQAIAQISENYFEGLAREFYKKLIIYYTKERSVSLEFLRTELKMNKNEVLESFFEGLVLLAETEFVEMTPREVAHEFDAAAFYLKNQDLSRRRTILQQQIKTAEQNNNMELANRLLMEFAKIN